MTTLQSRRKLIVILLLCVAVGGALLRHFAPPPSTLRDVGTLLMLLWIPIVGNIIGWLIGRLRKPVAVAVSPFDDAAHPFTPQLRVEFTLRPPQLPSEDTPIVAGEHRCALVVDNEGFTARWRVAPGAGFRRGDAQTLPVEFLAPALALPKFRPGTAFRMMIHDGSFVGDGRVLEVLSGS